MFEKLDILLGEILMDYRPWTWRVPENYKGTHGTISRQDAHERVSGKAVYTRDVFLPGMLYAKILTSPYAHAKIANIDTSEAESLPGVRDILKYSDEDIANDSATGPWYEISGKYDIIIGTRPVLFAPVKKIALRDIGFLVESREVIYII